MADYFEEARQTDTTMTVTTTEATALAAPLTEGPTIMAYPPGVSLATITIGAGRTMFGAAPKLISATVTPIFVGTPHVVHAASGWAFYPSPQTFRVENGEELSFELPHVNAEGWRDTAGNEFPALLPSGERDRGWAYHAKFTVIGGSGQDAIPHRYEKVFQPIVGQTEPLDIDLVPDGQIGEPLSAPIAVVTSIDGKTGPVNLDGLYLTAEDGAALAEAAGDQAVLDAGTYTDLVRDDLTPGNGNRPVGRSELVVNVRDHGATGNGSTNDTLAIQAAINEAVTAGGGTVFVPAGRYIVTAPLVISGASVSMQGVGPMSSAIETPDSIDVLVIDGGESSVGDGCAVENLRIRMTGTATSGAAVVLKSGFGHRMSHVRLSHYDCVRVEDASGYFVGGGSYLLAYGRYGVYNRSIRHPDRGDSVISGNTFNDGSGNSIAAICAESGGGLKISDNKLLQHQYGVLLQPEEYTTALATSAASGATTVTLSSATGLTHNGQLHIGGTTYTVASFAGATATLTSGLGAAAAAGAPVLVGIATSVFPITGNSMEGQKVAHVKAKRKGAVGQFSFINVTGGQYNGSAAGGTITDGFLIGAGANHGSLTDAVMSGRTTATAAHFETGADNWLVDNLNAATFLNGVQIDNGAADILVGEGNKFRHNVTYPLVNNSASTALAPAKQARYTRYTGYISSTTTWNRLFRVETQVARSILCELLVEGTGQSGVGPVFRHITFAVTRPVSAAGASTVTVISDTAVGVPVDVGFDTATTAGAVTVQLRRSSADGAIGISGTAALRVEGNLSRIQLP